MNFKCINKFDDIEILCDKTLVICDIDKTILYHDVEIDNFVSILKKDGFNDEKELLRLANEMLNMHCCIFSPKPTDPEGFKNFLNKIEKINSKIIFLTSRSELSEKITRKHFNDISLNYDDYKICYTDNKISKGEYIKFNININQCNEVIFIDDLDFNLYSVSSLFPQIKCYKFQI
jgi:hypothetical protein